MAHWHIVTLLDAHGGLARAYDATNALLAELKPVLTEKQYCDVDNRISSALVNLADAAFLFGVEFAQNPLPYLLVEEQGEA